MRLPGTIEVVAHCERCAASCHASTLRRAKQLLREHHRTEQCNRSIAKPCEYEYPARDYRYCKAHQAWAHPLDANCAKKNKEAHDD